MKPIDELLRNLRRPEVLEFALASERLPCVKVGASFQPVDGGAPTTDQVLEMLVAAGGSRYVDALHEAPTRWSFRLEGVGTIAISAVLRVGIVQARFTLTKREAPTRHDSATMTAAAPPMKPDIPSPIAGSSSSSSSSSGRSGNAKPDLELRHPSDDDEPTMVSELGNSPPPAGNAPQVIVKDAMKPATGAGAKPPRKETPRGQKATQQAPAKEAPKASPAMSALTGSANTAKANAAPAARPAVAPMAAGKPAAPPIVPSSAVAKAPVPSAPTAPTPMGAIGGMAAPGAKSPPTPESVTTTTSPVPTARAKLSVPTPPPSLDDDEPATRQNDLKSDPKAKAAPPIIAVAAPSASQAAPVPPSEDPASSVEHARIFAPSGGAAAPAPAPVAASVAPMQSPVNAGRNGQKIATPSSLRELLAVARKMAASDLHVVAGRPPLLRMAGELISHGSASIDPAEVEKMARAIVPPRLLAALDADGSCDFAFDEEGVGRFRCNVSRQRTGYKLALRLIPPGVPTLAALGLPPEIGQATHHHQGLIVVTGPTGHGKTTTLAALVNLINSETTRHVITVEDPVEYVHPRKRATMSQREVGTHTRTFAAALKASLRQDPDVVVVGELRDTETVRMALSASETGHLVLGTMNTPSAAKTIDRLIDLFPPADQAQVRATLAGGLRLIVSQRLIPSADRRSMHAVAELLPGSTALYSLIRDNKTFQIPSLQQRGRGAGMIRLDDSLADLVRAGKTSIEIARAAAESPEELDAQLRANPPPANVQSAGAVPPPMANVRPGSSPGPLGPSVPGAPGAPGAASPLDKSKAPQGSLFQRAGSLFNNTKKD